MKRLPCFFPILCTLFFVCGCSNGPLERARLDLEIGVAEVDGVKVTVRNGNALVDGMEAGRLDLWFSAPVQEISLEIGAAAVLDWVLTVRNAPADSELALTGDATALFLPSDGLTEKRWRLQLSPDSVVTMRIAPPDADRVEPFRVAYLSDI